MTFNFKNALLTGTALVAVGAFAITDVRAAEYDTVGAAEDWGGVASDAAGTDADSIHFDTAGDDVIVDDAEDIGTTTNNSLSMSIDTRSNAGQVTFDGGALAPATGSIVYGAVGDSSDFTATGNVATLVIGDGGNNQGANVSLYGNVAAGTVINFDTGVGTTTTLTLGDGSTDITVAGDIDLDEGTAGDSDSILNLNGVTVTGTIIDTDADNTTAHAINVDATSSLDGNVVLDGAGADVIVDDGLTLNVGATTFNLTATGTVTLGDATTDSATLVFDGTGAQAVTGLIDSDIVNTGAISITNTGGTVTFNQAIGATLDLATFTLADNADAVTVGNLNVNTVTIGSGATLDAREDITGNVVNAGTLTIGTGGGDVVTGNITGSTGAITAAGSATVDGNVAGATLLVTGAANDLTIDADTAAADSTVDVTTTTLDDADAGLIIGSATSQTLTFTGDIVADQAGDGDLTLGADVAAAETVVLNGNVGADGTAIDDIVAGDTNAAADTLSITGNVYADNLTVGNADTLTLTGDTVELATIVGSGAGEGSLVIGDGTNATAATLSGAIGAGDTELAGLQVTSGSTLNITDNLTMRSATDGALDIDGTLVVDSAGDVSILNDLAGNMQLDGTLTVNGSVGTLTLGDNMTAIEVGFAGNGATINIGNVIQLGDAMTIGDTSGDTATLVYNETAAFDPDATTGLDANGEALTFTTGSVTTVRLGTSVNPWVAGDTVTFIDGGAGGTNIATALGDGRIVFATDGLIELTDNGSDANTLTADVSYRAASSVFTAGSSGTGAADFVMALGAGGGTDLQTFRSSLIASSGATAQNLAETAAPEVDAAFVGAGNTATNLTVDANSSRIDVARGTGDATGMVAGEMGQGVTFWGKGFGQWAEQDTRDGIDGYESDTYGMAVGVDSDEVIKGALVGVSLSYANTDVDSEGANSTETDVDTYQLTFYGNVDLNDGMYVNGMVGYGRSNIDQDRFNVLNVAGNTANADFDSDQYSLYAEFGKDYKMDGMMVTPHVLANYQHFEFDSYTETGTTSGGALSNSTDDMDIFELGLGVTAAWMLQDDMGNAVVPSLSAEYRYDFVADEVASTSSFTGVGGSFQTEGFEPDESTFTLGAGIAYEVDENWTINADYGYQFKEDYDAHNLAVRAGFNF